MKRILILFLLFTVVMDVSSQRLSFDKYWIQLRDKQGTEFTVSQPEEFLSERAIERRNKQNIEITTGDLPVSSDYVDSLRSLGLEILGTSRWMNAVIVRSTDTIALKEASAFPFVIDFSLEFENFSMGGIEKYNAIDTATYRLKKEMEIMQYGMTSTQISMLGGNFLHNYGYTGEGILIAVLDAGFYRVDEIEAFNKLWEENRIIAYRDFVDNESDFFSQSSHGLSVLSTMAANIPDRYVGTAPGASYLLLRSEDARSENKIEEANWVMAAEYADSIGADIITTSLGYYDFPVSDDMNYLFRDIDGKSALVTRAAEMAFDRGMIVVASAGNEGNNDKWQRITPPSDGPNVLAVGSVDTSFEVTSFSSRGNTFDGRIKPDLMAVGYKTKVISFDGMPSEGYGTSFAAPQISGLIACLWESAPEKTNREIIEAVRKSGNQYANPDSISGFGIPNFMYALWEVNNTNQTPIREEIKVYPNPFSQKFEIQLNNKDNAIYRIDILTSDGKIINSYEINDGPGKSITIECLETNPAGIYYLIGKTTSGKDIVSRLIKQ